MSLETASRERLGLFMLKVHYPTNNDGKSATVEDTFLFEITWLNGIILKSGKKTKSNNQPSDLQEGGKPAVITEIPRVSVYADSFYTVNGNEYSY